MPFAAAALATAAASGLLGLLVLLVLALLMMLVCRAVLGFVLAFVLVSLLLLLVLLGIGRRGAHALVGRWWHAVGCGCGVDCVSSKSMHHGPADLKRARHRAPPLLCRCHKPQL